MLGLVLLCLWGPQCRAQEVKLLGRNVQVHGFASQGFIYTNQNNWLTMNTSEGSGTATEMGLNASSQLTDRFRVGAQVYDRNLGELGQWHPTLDWAVADYRFKDWFGIRAGKVKTILGLFNDSQDLDFLRVFALLPQGIYPTDLRDTTIAHDGGDIYGNISLGNKHGSLIYTAYAGYRNDSVYSGYPYMLKPLGIDFDSLGGLQYGGDLRWITPLNGLLIGLSRMNQEIAGKGTLVSQWNPVPGPIPYRITTTAFWTNQFYGEYSWHKLQLDSEYRRCFNDVPTMPGSSVSTDARAWYLSGSYRVHKRIQLGSYYSHYSFTTVSQGPVALLWPSQSDTSSPKNHIYDKVFAARFDLNRFIFVKAEGHFIDGYGLGAYPDGFYMQQNPLGFQQYTNALVLKTGFHF